MALDATHTSQRREQDVRDGPGCLAEVPEKRAGCQRWPWMPPRGAREESRMSAMALDATQRSQRREQDVSDGPGCHPEESEKRAGCQRWPWMPPRGGREESRVSEMALDDTQRGQRREQGVSDGPGCHPEGQGVSDGPECHPEEKRREQDVSDGPGCHPEKTEKRAGCQRWPWMPPRGDREESRVSVMALNATQRRQRREQGVSQ